MIIFNSTEQFPKNNGAVVTIGSFDGVHQGHRKVLQQLTQTAQSKGYISVVVTFYPHPREVLYNQSDFFLISSYEDKKTLLCAENIDYLMVIPFSKDFANMTSEQFIQDILIEKIGAKAIVMGPNHRFGRNREGDYNNTHELCESNGIEVIKIDEFLLHDIAIRSTQIRKMISDKRYTEAEELLGHHLFIKRD
jgi:riboflavin kinase / FMN adenylyltransferase